MHPPACKVFRWIRKAGDATICRRPKLDDDNNSIISTHIDYSHNIRRRHKPSHKSIKHEAGEREIWRNKVGGDFSPTNSLRDGKGKKKHKSLPIPPRKPVNHAEEGTSKVNGGIVVDTRRFCMVDPFNLGGHRRSYTLDTTWNITAYFDNVTGDKDDESPATILIAKKENLARSNRFSIQPTRRNSKKRSIAKEIKEVEVRTFRWESRRTNREKTCSQLYELYENQLDHILINDIQDKPLPPVPKDVTQDKYINDDNEESDIIIDPELQSIIDTLSLISDRHSDVFDDSTTIYTQSSTARESFSELLITEENLFEDEISTPSVRNSVNSFNTLPTDVEMCLSCKRRSTDSGYSIQWCKACEMKRFEEQFESWSSGNDDVDCFILESQLNSTNFFDHLEWISFDRFQDVELINTGDYECTFQAIWLDGPRNRWDIKSNRYVGCGECLVVLKFLEIPQDSSSDFFEQLTKHLLCENNSGTHIIRCYGITQDPRTEKYMLVLQYAKEGNISHYLKQNFADITWQKRLEILYALAEGLYFIHEKNLVHGNLHSGNILLDDSLTLISDLGRHPISFNNGAYGVLPFIAPELLKNKPYTMASDIYSFGTIMWELVVGKAPFADRAHDEKLATEICKNGLRPEIPTDIPKCFTKLLRQCWNPNPFKRPCANILRETINEWISSNTLSEITIQFQQSEEKRLENVTTTNTQLDDEVHPEAVYTNKFFNYENLYEPNVIFTKSLNPKEHLALQEYIVNETGFYNLKVNSLKAESSDIAGEIYEILQYW